jgi:ribosomal protein L14
MEEAINLVVKETIEATGRIIGAPLAIRLISEEFERVQSFNKEIGKVAVSGKSIKVSIKKGTPEKRAGEILMSFITAMEGAYSKIIGQVARTMIKKSLESAAKKYRKYKTLQEIAKKY